MAAERVDRSGPRQNFATGGYASRDEVFLPGPHWNPISVEDQRVAALNNYHVFVVIVDVLGGYHPSWCKSRMPFGCRYSRRTRTLQHRE